jgi:tripartite-type tricarboxylate transporter receptor subunit TctC
MISGPIGGMMDINARLIATELTKQMGQQVIVDNRPGAGGIIAMEIVARAAPDGYTIGQVASNFAANPSLYAKLPYDSEQDFQPVVYTGFSTLILAVTPALPIRSVKELLAHARANPGKLSYGGLGAGSVQVLSMELLKHQTGANIVLVSYKSDQQAITDVMGGQVTEINKALLSPLIAEKFAANGYTAGGGTPEQYAAQLREEAVKWAKVIKAAGIKPQ